MKKTKSKSNKIIKKITNFDNGAAAYDMKKVETPEEWYRMSKEMTEEYLKDKKNQSILQKEMEDDYLKLIKQIDKIFEKEFGKMCPDFEPGCVQCTAHLIYNNFKRQLWEAFVK